jgi:hypothetical protein
MESGAPIFLHTNDVSTVRSRSLPYGTSDPHRERDEASPGRDEGARAGTNTLSQSRFDRLSIFLISIAHLINLVTLNVVAKHAIWISRRNLLSSTSRYALSIHNAYSQSL